MTKTKLGMGLLGIAMALMGCAGGSTTGVETGALDTSVVPASIDGRSDLYLDLVQSNHLLTLDEVNGSPTAVRVEVQITESELIAWRAGVPAASRTDADFLGSFAIVGETELGVIRTIDNETHPSDPGSIVLPRGSFGNFNGGRQTTGPSTPPLRDVPDFGLTIDWTQLNRIPNQVDTLPNVAGAHPGCA